MACSSADKEQLLRHHVVNYSRSFYDLGELVVLLNKN